MLARQALCEQRCCSCCYDDSAMNDDARTDAALLGCDCCCCCCRCCCCKDSCSSFCTLKTKLVRPESHVELSQQSPFKFTVTVQFEPALPCDKLLVINRPTTTTTMPPLSLQPDDHDAAVDHGRSSGSIELGFSSNLLETIRDSKSKITAWVDLEKAKADQAAAAYRKRLHEEQAAIDAKVTELRTVQLEVGMNKNDDGNNGNRGLKDHGDNLAIRKKALEEQTAKIQLEIMKLQTERNNRERRVQDIMLEESKQRMRAEEARALKKQAEEAKKTTVDDLTKGIVNYKYLGLDFEKTDEENELRYVACG